ncbi:MAG: FG-GAP repeat domain-containing protein [Acidimicrobiales bacterium]
MSGKRRKGVFVLTAAGGLLVTPRPAVAQPAPPISSDPGVGAAAVDGDIFNLGGNFVGDAQEEIFQYRAGTGADFLWTFSKVGGVLQATPFSYSVDTVYEPVVGDFDGDGYDDIFWHGPGTVPELIWDFSGGFTPTVVTPAGSANLTYVIVAGDFTGDGADDVLFYRAGTGNDSIWDFEPGTEFSFTGSLTPLPLNNTYVPVAGTFTGDGAADVVWYDPGSATDYMWDFVPAATPTMTSPVVGPIDGESYKPFTVDRRNDGRDDIFWYTPESGTDPYWDHRPAGRVDDLYTVTGTFWPGTGDLFGDGNDDILWEGAEESFIWDYEPAVDGGFTLTIWDFGRSLAAAADAAFAAEGASAAEPGTVTITATESTTIVSG